MRPTAVLLAAVAAAAIAAAVTTTTATAQRPMHVKNTVFSSDDTDAFVPMNAAAIGLAGLGGGDAAMVMALGDLNSDKYTDLAVLITAGDDAGCVRLLLWDHAEYTFVQSTVRVCPAKERLVWNVLMTDLDYDGRLDIILTTVRLDDVTKSTSASLASEMCIVRGNTLQSAWDATESSVTCSPLLLNDPPSDSDSDSDATNTLVGQWTVFTLNGQMRPDLFGSIGSGAGSALITYDITLESFVRRASPFPGACSLAAEHSHAFIDVDGDCSPDVLLTCAPIYSGRSWSSAVEVWLSKPSAEGITFEKHSAIFISERVGAISFVDIDADGDMDMTYVACSDQSKDTKCISGTQLYVHLNHQAPLCSNSADQINCRLETELCTADPSFSFSDRVPWSITASVPSHYSILLRPMLVSSSPYPASLLPTRWGDYNLDGYPDALLTFADPTAINDNGTLVTRTSDNHSRLTFCGEVQNTRIQLLASVSCDGTPAKSKCSENASRALSADESKVAAINTDVVGGQSAFFFDLDEKGRLDVIIMGGGDVEAFYNDIHEDAFFMKTLGLNGVCFENCGIAVKPVGVNEPGVVVRFLVTNTDGVKRIVHGSQLPQFCFGALFTPYVSFGLGRTNSYIDQFEVGLLMQSDTHYHTWNGIIPNSQLVISPSLQDTGWQMELYILPSVYSIWVALVLFVTAFVLLLTVAFLHWIEMRADARERRGARMFVNFDAF